jgi:hypothetical protein
MSQNEIRILPKMVRQSTPKAPKGLEIAKKHNSISLNKKILPASEVPEVKEQAPTPAVIEHPNPGVLQEQKTIVFQKAFPGQIWVNEGIRLTVLAVHQPIAVVVAITENLESGELAETFAMSYTSFMQKCKLEIKDGSKNN